MANRWKEIQRLLDEAHELTVPFGEHYCDYADMSKSYALANKKVEQAYKILTGREYKPKP